MSGPISEKEAGDILRLRKQLDGKWGEVKNLPEFCSDWALLRFLRGYGSVDTAKENVLSLFKFLEGNNAFELRKKVVLGPGEPPEALFDLNRLPYAEAVLSTYPERFYHREDTMGNPIMVTTADHIKNVDGLMNSITPEQYVEFRVCRLLMLQMLLHELSNKHQRLIRVSMVWDLRGISKAIYDKWQEKHVVEYWGDFVKRATPCFPEIVNKVIVLNMPWFLHILWKAFKVTLPKRVVQKVVICGSDISAVETHAQIPLERLPAAIGGKCETDIGEYKPPELSEYYDLCTRILSIVK